MFLPDGSERQLDVVVADGTSEVASERLVLSIGEAKAGERISQRHLRRLEEARRALGRRAAGAKLLLFGGDFTPELAAVGATRTDVEVIGLERLYAGT